MGQKLSNIPEQTTFARTEWHIRPSVEYQRTDFSDSHATFRAAFTDFWKRNDARNYRVPHVARPLRAPLGNAQTAISETGQHRSGFGVTVR